MNRTTKSDKILSVTTKLQLVVFAIVLLIMGIQTGLNIRNTRQRNETETKQNLVTFYNEFNDDVKILEDTAAALSLSFAQRPDVRDRFRAKDRQGLLALLAPVFTSLETDYNVMHLQFREPNGGVFLRIHDPEQNGADTLTYPQPGTLTRPSQQTGAGLEIGPNYLAVQGVSPVFYQDQFIGLVEVGLDYDQDFIEDFKAQHGGNDYKIWLTYQDATPAGLEPVAGAPESPSPEIFYYTGTSSTMLPIPVEVYPTVLQTGTPQTHFVSTDNQEWAVLVGPMRGYGDRMIGLLEISISREQALAALYRDRMISLAINGGLVLLTLILMWISTHFIVLRPLRHLTAVTRDHLKGNLTARVEVLPRDEFGELGHTFNMLTETSSVLTETLDEILEDQEDIIAERTARYRSIFEDSPISLWEQDFSEVKRYLDDLRDAGVSDFRAYFEDDPEVITYCAGLVKILDVNQATLDLFQAKHKAEILAGLEVVFSEGSLATFREELVALAEGKTRFENEVVFKTLKGDEVQTVLSLAVAPGYEETKAKVFVSIIDITKRVQMEEELKEHREHLEELVDERTAELNRRLVEIEQLNRAMANLLEDLQAANHNLEQTAMKLREVNKELQEFAYVASHDLKAPLRGIIQLANWLLTDYGDALDEDGQEMIQLLIDRTKRMYNLIEGILQYSRIGRVVEKERKVDLNRLVTDLIEMLSPPETIEVIIENKLPTVIGDRTRLGQVFQNLLGNALKFVDKPQGWTRINYVDEEAYWLFSVADNGPGIEEKYYPKIFQMFQTLISRDELESTGVGLALVKKVVEGWEGKIWVESTIGQGSTFYFTLPKKEKPHEKR